MSEAENGSASGIARGGASARRSWLRYVPLIVFGVFAIVFAVQLGGQGAPLVGNPAPEFVARPIAGLVYADGEAVPGFDSESFLGEVTIMNVWASWCVPCIQEHPLLTELAEDDRFQVFGLNHKDTESGARAFLANLGNPFDAVGDDASGAIATAYDNRGVPETYIIDREGIVRYHFIGPLTESRLRNELLPELEAVLAEAPEA